jgi:hypothetical protein
MWSGEKQTDFGSVFVIAIVILCGLAWFTHIIVSLVEGWWGFLVAGALFFPIGIIHGIGLWFGFF